MMQKWVKMSVPGIKAKTGGRGNRRPSAEPSPIVLTIGHSTRTIEEFIGLLQAHGATRVADVRTVPRSRHNPQFNKTSLPRALKKAGLGYVHMPGLGGLRHAKRDSLNVGLTGRISQTPSAASAAHQRSDCRWPARTKRPLRPLCSARRP